MKCQELELSVRINPNVHCTTVQLKIPLKKTDSGKEKPVEISANYTNINSPRKQAEVSRRWELHRITTFRPDHGVFWKVERRPQDSEAEVARFLSVNQITEPKEQAAGF